MKICGWKGFAAFWMEDKPTILTPEAAVAFARKYCARPAIGVLTDKQLVDLMLNGRALISDGHPAEEAPVIVDSDGQLERR